MDNRLWEAAIFCLITYNIMHYKDISLLFAYAGNLRSKCTLLLLT